MSLLAGRGNVGKSPCALWIAACLTQGELPGQWFGTPTDVVIYASEDSHEHTTIPRLIAAGADMDRIHLLMGTATDEDGEQPLAWLRDLPLIERFVTEVGAATVVIDPLHDVHRSGADTNRTDDVRAGLRPLVAMAHRTRAAVLGIAHFNEQRTGDLAALLSGSHGLRDTVRAVLAFVEGPDGERVLGQDKNNLGRSGDDVPRLTYEMTSVDVLIEGEKVSQPVFTITGSTDSTLSELMLGEKEKPDSSELPANLTWLLDMAHGRAPRTGTGADADGRSQRSRPEVGHREAEGGSDRLVPRREEDGRGAAFAVGVVPARRRCRVSRAHTRAGSYTPLLSLFPLTCGNTVPLVIPLLSPSNPSPLSRTTTRGTGRGNT